jgi:Glycosyltransferase family 92
MLNIYIPQPVYGAHAHERLICADATHNGRSVFLHVAHYPDFAAPVESVELRQGDVCLKGQSLGHPETMAYQFELPQACEHHRFNVHVNGAFCGRVEAQAFTAAQPVFLTAATLFKGDYAQVRTWMDYHAALGFERFVLYYNGKLDAILPELLAQSSVTDKDVLLVQWPYTYWVEGLGLGVEGLLAEQGERADLSRCGKDWHHAQQMMLNHALLLLQGSTEYLGFFDLDEYFRMEQPGALVDLLHRGQSDVYIFQSRWSELASGHVPALTDSAHFFAREEVLVSPDWVPFPGRTKYIARPQTILGTGAHVPKATVAGTKMVKVDTDLAGVYHFHCFSGKASRRQLVNPAGQWVSMPDFYAQGAGLRAVQRDAA